MVQELTEANRIDRYELMMDPIVLGEGVTFLNNTPMQFKRTDCKLFKQTGTLIVAYERL